MLLGNFSYRTANPGREIGGQYRNKFNWRKAGSCMQFYFGDHVVTNETIKSSFPNGYVPHASFILAPKAGGMSTINEVEGVGTLSGNAVKGINILSALSGSGGFATSSLSMIVQAVAALTGSGSLSGSMVLKLAMASDLAGSGNVTAALKVIAGVVGNLTGSGTVSANLRGTLTLEADITPFTELSPENLAAAVWNALCAAYNESGTFGKLVQDTEKKVDDNQALILTK